ncbi:hypothetical protein C9374_007550 [Naegleria lovaniensis]|uniref:Rho-GAP domain-containing protein n=1 Tax=Naegleria lovaniensis TaxID=51637 RepID=A0AA88GLN1_NAELO|nr:uncharacterized protein C9374_007550 [Naegleria lovaniensis]KAG2379411.1 hypothetical protein C9374_007550 [Naegleria lovaniensis]
MGNKQTKNGLMAISRASIEAQPPHGIYKDYMTTNNNNNTSVKSTNNNNNTTTTNGQNNNQITTAANDEVSQASSNAPTADYMESPTMFSNLPTAVFGVDLATAVQRSCKLLIKTYVREKRTGTTIDHQQDPNHSTSTTTNNHDSSSTNNTLTPPVVEMGSPSSVTTTTSTTSTSNTTFHHHPEASHDELEYIETVNQHLETLYIPDVIKQSLRFLNSYDSLIEKGIYRIPGDTKRVKEYRDCFDRGESIDFLAENTEIDRKKQLDKENGKTMVDACHHGIKHDALDVAGLIKLYLRELPGEALLFTPQTAQEFTVSFLKNIVNEEDKVASVKRSIGRLPRANKETLQALAEHFRLVTKYEKKNKMSIDNLIKCVCGTSPFVSSIYIMVQYYDEIFKPESNKPHEEDPNSTKNLEWLLIAQERQMNMGGNNNLSNEALAGKAMNARESRRKSYYQRQQQREASETTPTTDNSDFLVNSPVTTGGISGEMDSITQVLLRMKKEKSDQQSHNHDSTTTTDDSNQTSSQHDVNSNSTELSSSIVECQ